MTCDFMQAERLVFASSPPPRPQTFPLSATVYAAQCIFILFLFYFTHCFILFNCFLLLFKCIIPVLAACDGLRCCLRHTHPRHRGRRPATTHQTKYNGFVNYESLLSLRKVQGFHKCRVSCINGKLTYRLEFRHLLYNLRMPSRYAYRATRAYPPSPPISGE